MSDWLLQADDGLGWRSLVKQCPDSCWFKTPENIQESPGGGGWKYKQNKERKKERKPPCL